MTIRTVAVSGITEVNFDPDGKNPYFYSSEKFCWIKNKSNSAMYVSLDENCIADADGTAQISSGECGMIILSAENKIYLSGSGDAEIKTSDFAECPFKTASKGGGSGGTTDYAELSNKPKINNITLSGNKSFSDLGLEWITPGVIAEEFDTSKNYSENDLLIYDSELYKCISDHSGAWDISDFEKVTVAECISSGGSAVNVVDSPTAEEIAASVAEIWG